MTRRKKVALGGLGVVALAALAYLNVAFNRSDAPSVTVEAVRRLDLEATVSASGKVEPKQSVDISAETMGKVITLAVAEGQTVGRGDLLLEIDPRNLETQVQNRQASLALARSQLEQTKAQVENARVALAQAQDTLRRQEELWKAGLIPREQYERAVNDAKVQETNLQVSQQSVETQEQRIRQESANLESAQYDLNKVRVVSPIDGIVTRRNIEIGETAVVGTMNNAGTVLLTIADLSVIETEIEVDETDVPFIQIGQAAEVTIDAMPDRTFSGSVTEVGNSPIQATGANAATQRATNFKVVVTIDGEVPGVRPGFTCTAVITTATRQQALAVPIQAVTVRELVVDAEGAFVPAEPPRGDGSRAPASPPAELPPGHSRKEVEGVFVVRDGRAVFAPIEIGIAGERHFEVLGGLGEGDRVITGPFASVRDLRDGDAVEVGAAPAAPRP
jgi:HlyD family secretion protein